MTEPPARPQREALDSVDQRPWHTDASGSYTFRPYWPYVPGESFMPQTNPFHSMVPRKMTDSELARAIRLDMEAELDAINLYAAHVDATDNEEAKAILRHVVDEEREHAALFWELIARLDPAQAEHIKVVSEKYRLIVSGAPHEAVEAVGEGGERSAAAEPGLDKRLTVGSLRR